jgi:hypothetical protein
MSVRDRILPVLDRARATIASLGLRRYRVILRRRVWSGRRAGEGTSEDVDQVILPAPKVVLLPPQAVEAIVPSGGTIEDRYFKVTRITPRFTGRDGRPGGHAPDELRLFSRGANEEVFVVLIGDDGRERICTLVAQDFSRPFRYELVVRLRRDAK